MTDSANASPGPTGTDPHRTGQLRDDALAELQEVQERISALQLEARKLVGQIAALDILLGHTQLDASATPAHYVNDRTPTLVCYVHAILASAGEPLHYREIHRRAHSLGARVAGRDPAANLLQKFYNHPNFTRVAPGCYAIAHPEEKP